MRIALNETGLKKKDKAKTTNYYFFEFVEI